MEDLLTTNSYIKTVLNVAEHCNEDRLTAYVREIQNTDIQNYLGHAFFHEVLENHNDTKYCGLLEGGTYEDCQGKTRRHFGLMRVHAHLAYGAYMYRSGFIDTPSGVKQKLYEDSIPAPIDELRRIRNEHRKIATEYWKAVEDYIYHTEGFDSHCNSCDEICGCKKCGCSNDNYSTTRSPRFSVVSTIEERGTHSSRQQTISLGTSSSKGKFVTSVTGNSYFGEPTSEGDYVVWTTQYDHPLDGVGTYRLELIYNGGDTNLLTSYTVNGGVRVL